MHRAVVLLIASAVVLGACSSSTSVATPATSAASASTIVPSSSAADETTSLPGVSAPRASATTAASGAPVATGFGQTTSTGATTTGAVRSSPPPTDPTIARPFDVFVPTTYSTSTAMPLVILLHGYGASGAAQEAYFKLQALAEQRGFLYVHPDGTKDPGGSRFWNATDACCNLFGATVDDSAYLTSIIDHVQAKYSVDPKRIFLIGHSNGGFMSYRMACDHADMIAAIVSLAGATFADTSACKPSEPVSVLEIHGDADHTINYDGASIAGHTYPGAKTTVSTWASFDGCDPALRSVGPKLDLEAKIAGAETSQSAFNGCRSGSAVELWTVAGGGHIPPLSATFPSDVIDFLLGHPKT